MVSKFIYTCIALIFLPAALFSQKKKNDFCGWRYKDTAVIREQYEKQLVFLRISDNDTIVDIGSASGSMEGCLNTIGNYANVNFVLVDIDTNCLSREKVNDMSFWYSNLRGQPDKQRYTIVNNTPDSLYLPTNSYRKVWLMNTLHEIGSLEKMVRDIADILQPGGELVLLEILSRPKHTIHGGCKFPLLDEEQIKTLFEKNGFAQADVLWNPTNTKRKVKNPYYMVRFIKTNK